MFPEIPSLWEPAYASAFFPTNLRNPIPARVLLASLGGGVMENAWLQQCIGEMAELVGRPINPEHQGLEDLARGYSHGIANWLQAAGAAQPGDCTDPRSVILHLGACIPTKIYRALTALDRRHGNPGGWPADHDGSAKAALIAIERSRAAWIELAKRGLAPIADADRFVSDLSHLADCLDRVKATRIARPGISRH